jgi:hypothetical protein
MGLHLLLHRVGYVVLLLRPTPSVCCVGTALGMWGLVKFACGLAIPTTFFLSPPTATRVGRMTHQSESFIHRSIKLSKKIATYR